VAVNFSVRPGTSITWWVVCSDGSFGGSFVLSLAPSACGGGVSVTSWLAAGMDNQPSTRLATIDRRIAMFMPVLSKLPASQPRQSNRRGAAGASKIMVRWVKVKQSPMWCVNKAGKSH
jgi:hypothetical protein